MGEIDDPIFGIIPRSTAAQPQETAAGYGTVPARLRQMIVHSTAPMSGYELYVALYPGPERPSFNAFEKQLAALNDTLAAEGSTWRVGSTTWYGKCAPEEVRRRPRKPSGGSSEPSA